MNAPRPQNRLLRFGLVAAALASSLAGCGGGTGGTVSPAPNAVSGQAGPPVAGSIVIRMPRASSSTTRRPRYVSLASGSAKIAIAPAQGCIQCSSPVTIEATLVGPCKMVGQVRTCTIPLSLVPGTYAGTISIYDGVPDAQGHVTGKVLSTNASFPILIAQGQANSVGVTLDGIPTSLVATILTPSTMIMRNRVVNGVTQTVYRVFGANASAQIGLVAKDADGFTIVGPGSPTWTANANPAGFTTAVNGNTLTLTAPAAPKRADAALTINAVSSGCSDPTAKCTLSGFVGFVETLAATAPGNLQVSVWAIGGSALPTAITQGLSFPCPAVAFASDGTLFVANGGNDTVTAYAPPYTGAPKVISAGIKGPVSLAVDASNDLIVANSTNLNVTIYPPPYTTAAPTALSDLAGASPAGVVVDAGNHLWIVGNTPYLLRYSAPYVPGAFDVAIGGFQSTLNTPSALAVDAAGRPYVADSVSNKIVRFDPPFSNTGPALTISSTASQKIMSPSALAVAPDGTIFVVNLGGLGFYSPTGAPLGVATGFYNSNLPLGPNELAADSDGTMWLARGEPGFPTPYGPANFTSLTVYSATGDAIAIYP
jgi:hypothetical protein